jgi:predicted RNase H-like nuclease (RuvC/YqgF family)
MFDKPGQYKVYVVSWKVMISCAVLISMLCFFGGWWVGGRGNSVEQVKTEINSIKDKLDDVTAQLTRNKKQVDSLTTENAVLIRKSIEDNKTMNDRLILLSCLFNENFAAHQAKSNDFIFIEREWKINRLPKQLDMNQQDTEWLMMFLNREASLTPLVPGAPRMPEPK